MNTEDNSWTMEHGYSMSEMDLDQVAGLADAATVRTSFEALLRRGLLDLVDEVRRLRDQRNPGHSSDGEGRCPETLHCYHSESHGGPHQAIAGGGDSTHEWQKASEFSRDAMDWTPSPE